MYKYILDLEEGRKKKYEKKSRRDNDYISKKERTK